MRHFQRKASLLLSTLLLLSGDSLAQVKEGNSGNNNDEHHPAPEPYSFSFSSDSIGGSTTREETGDANGRVTGFYMMMGDDGRERRVDYVADENGYRASISTNEVGTRSESSADAQFNARLPSDQQLVQAKISAEDYRYLEETQQAERERHLNWANQNAQVQHQLKHQSAFQASNTLSSQQAGGVQQQQRAQPPRWIGANTAQASGFKSTSPAAVSTQPYTSSVPEATTSPNVEVAKPIWDENAEWRSRLLSANTSFVQPSIGQSSPPPPPPSPPPPQPQPISRVQPVQSNQARQSTWQEISRDKNERSSANSAGSLGLLRQIEQQFVAQASALANQDYPRQREQQQQQFDSQAEISQAGQQQSNIIDELPGQMEQVDGPQEEQQTPTTTTTTTTTTVAPSRFVSINLQESDESDKQQEVDRLAERIPVRVPQFELKGQIAGGQMIAQVEREQQRPNSIKQLIQSIQQMPIQQLMRTTTTTTTSTTSKPVTTTLQAVQSTEPEPVRTTSTTTTTTTPEPQIVETTPQAPLIVVEQPTTTTSRPTVIQQQRLSTTTQATLEPSTASWVPVNQPDKRPTISQPIVYGQTKGQSVGRLSPSYEDLRRNYTHFNRQTAYLAPTSSAKVAQMDEIIQTSGEQKIRTEPVRQVVAIVPSLQKLQPAVVQTAGYTTQTSYVAQRQQKQSTPVTTLRPTVVVEVQARLQQKQQPWKGVKGGSKLFPKRQFWQQPQQQQNGLEYSNSTNYGARISG